MQYIFFCNRHILFSIVFPKFIHAIGRVSQSFLLLYNIPLYEKTTFGHSVNIWWLLGCFHFLLWIMLLWTYVYKYLCGPTFLFLLSIKLRMELWDHSVSVLFEVLPGCLPKWLYNIILLYMYIKMSDGSNFSTSSSMLLIICLFYHTHPNVCESVSIGLICISVIVTDFEHLFIA